MQREAARDPRIIARKEMIRDIVTVTEPTRVVPIADIDEFKPGRAAAGEVILVSQGGMKSTETKPIRTDNASACNIFLIKSTSPDAEPTYSLMHVWAGDLDLNHPGARREDIKAKMRPNDEAIAITGGSSSPFELTAYQLRDMGVRTKTHIAVPSGRQYVSAVFRPLTNEIVVRIGSDSDATEAYVYEGF